MFVPGMSHPVSIFLPKLPISIALSDVSGKGRKLTSSLPLDLEAR